MTFQFPKLSYNSPEKSEVKSIVEQYRKARQKGEDGIAYTTQPYWYANRLSSRVMADTGYENSKMRYCESCGALIDVTKAYGGCPQCGSAIRVREAHKKIVTIDREMSGSWYQWRFIGGVFLAFMACMLIASLVELFREGDFTYDSVLGTFFMLLLSTLAFAPVGIVIGAIYGNFLFIPILISLHRSNARVNRVGYEMKKRDPQFSHTEFYGLILAQGEKLVKKRTTCTVRMKRREHVVTTHKADVLQCVKCGASLDMLGDGVCAYCGSRADIFSIDWMLCGVQVNG